MSLMGTRCERSVRRHLTHSRRAPDTFNTGQVQVVSGLQPEASQTPLDPRTQ